MSLLRLTTRRSKGTVLELAFAFPLLILLAIMLISIAQVYYTHNLLQNTVADTAQKVGILYRRQFFHINNIRAEEQFLQDLKQAIRNDSPISKLNLDFLDNADGLTIDFEDLGDGALDNSYNGALTLYYDPGLGETLISYLIGSGAIPSEIQNNCTDATTPRPMFFRPYKMRIQFKMPVTVRMIISRSFDITVESSSVINDLSFAEICSNLNL